MNHFESCRAPNNTQIVVLFRRLQDARLLALRKTRALPNADLDGRCLLNVLRTTCADSVQMVSVPEPAMP